MDVRFLRGVMLRDLQAVEREIAAYPDDRSLWAMVPGLPNSAGTLALHVAGNLQHFIGTVLGGSGYVRDREAEFGARGLSRDEILRQVGAARQSVGSTFEVLSDSVLEHDYPQPVAGVRVATGEFLLHLSSHLAYHLGQLDAHRRIATGNPRSVDAESIPALSTARPSGPER